MKQKIGIVLTLMALLLGIFLGCGGGGGNRGTSGGGTSLAPTGNIEGFLYAASGRAAGISLGLSATPPSGSGALAGVRVTVADSDISATTESNGHFLLKGASAGLRRLHLTTLDGTTADFPLTVLGDTTIQVGTPSITRQQAIDKVKLALGANTTLNTVLLMAPQQPLPTGVAVTPAFEALANDSTHTYTLPTSQWLVYADAYSEAAFGHTVTYYFVDAATAQLSSRTAGSWPDINGASYYGDDARNLSSPDLVQAPTRAAHAQTNRSTESVRLTATPLITRDHVGGCANPMVYTLFIEGENRPDMVKDIARLTGPGGPRFSGATPAQTIGYIAPTSGYVAAKAQIQEKFELLSRIITPCDYLFIYISAHGAPDGSIALRRGPADDGLTTTQLYSFLKLEKDLDFDHCPACHIIVTIQTCFSGKALADLQQHIQQNDVLYKGKKVYLMSACAADELSWVDLKTGSFFGQAFFDAMTSVGGTSGRVSLVNLDIVFSQASAAAQESTKDLVTNDADPKKLRKGEHPQYWARNPPGSEGCDGMGCIVEQEPNNDCPHGTPLQDSYCANGILNGLADKDHYSKYLAPGSYKLTISGLSSVGVYLSLPGKAEQIIPSFSTPIAFTVDTAGNACIGLYNGNGAYQLDLTRQ